MRGRNPFLARRTYDVRRVEEPTLPQHRLLFLDGRTVVNAAGERLLLISQMNTEEQHG